MVVVVVVVVLVLLVLVLLVLVVVPSILSGRIFKGGNLLQHEYLISDLLFFQVHSSARNCL